MALIELTLPRMGEGIIEATILKWHKKPGDRVEADETVLEVATDKVDSEVPSNTSGILKEILFNENAVVPVDAVIARIETEGGSVASAAPAPAATPQPAPTPVTVANNTPAPATNNTEITKNRFYSPLVLNIAQKEGIPLSDLEHIPGTGNNGRLTKHDLLKYIENGGQKNAIGPTPTTAPIENTTVTQQPVAAPKAATTNATKDYGKNVEVVQMDRMRKIIADHMIKSKATSPHVTSFTEADITNLVNWRDRHKKDFEKKYGEKITFMPIFIEAIANCIKDYPFINASLDGDNILLKKDINIGMATALPTGNLIVPVIKNANTKNLLGLAKDVNYLATAARSNKLKPDDTQGGTFTISNLGTFNNLMGTPIINQPQVAIMAIGAIKKRPVVLETPAGDVIAIRQMMYLSLSYDHRLVDGSLGASFLYAVTKYLEDFDPNREI